MNEIISSNKNYDYGYRIMEFYGFNLFEDNQSKTMNLILESINNIIENELGFYLKDEKNIKLKEDFENIIKDIYKELIDLVLSSEDPKFQEAKAIHFFEILFYSFLQKFKLKYKDEEEIFKENIKKFCKKIGDITVQISQKIQPKKDEYKIKYELNKNEQEIYEQDLEKKADNNYNKDFVLSKADKLKNYFINNKNNLEKYEKIIENISQNLNKIQKEKDINNIQININKTKEEI